MEVDKRGSEVVNRIAFSLFALLLLPAQARAEVLDKVGGPVSQWYIPAFGLALAFFLASRRPSLAFLVYPLSLLLSLGTLDVLHGELGPAVVREGGRLFVVNAYATILVNIAGPLLAFTIFRRRQRL